MYQVWCLALELQWCPEKQVLDFLGLRGRQDRYIYIYIGIYMYLSPIIGNIPISPIGFISLEKSVYGKREMDRLTYGNWISAYGG